MLEDTLLCTYRYIYIRHIPVYMLIAHKTGWGGGGGGIEINPLDNNNYFIRSKTTSE